MAVSPGLLKIRRCRPRFHNRGTAGNTQYTLAKIYYDNFRVGHTLQWTCERGRTRTCAPAASLPIAAALPSELPFRVPPHHLAARRRDLPFTMISSFCFPGTLAGGVLTDWPFLFGTVGRTRTCHLRTLHSAALPHLSYTVCVI